MGPNPNVALVDFQVSWPKLLFKSRPQFSCRDIIHVATSISRRDIELSLGSSQLRSSDVATSDSCRDITLCLCRFQLVAYDVATSISCRDISSWYCNFEMVSLGVATSISCRDITSWLRSFNCLLLVSRHQSLVVTSLSGSAGFT